MPVTQTRSSGQSITEYALISLCVLTICLGGLYKLGDVIRSGFNYKVVTSATGGAPNTGGFPGGGNTTSVSAGGTGVTILTKNGASLALENYPKDIGQTVATTGANGATSVLSDQIADMARQLKAGGAISAPQYNALVNLANKGHALANTEKQFETILANASSVDEMNRQINSDPSLSYGSDADGYFYHMGYYSIPFDGTASTADWMNPDGADGTTKDFLVAYQEVLSSGALDDPVVKQFVTKTSEQIGTMANMTVDGSYQVTHNSLDKNELTPKMAGTMTDRYSANICTTGSATDSGVHCSP